MNTHKIFKSYFAFICIISAVAMMTSNDAFNDSFVSVFHTTNMNHSRIIGAIKIQEIEYQSKNIESAKPVNLFVLPNESKFIKPNMTTAMHKSGDIKNMIEAMKIVILNKSIKELKSINFTLQGITNKNVKKSILVIGDKIIYGTLNSNSNILFDNINSKLEIGKSNLSVEIELEKNIKIGTRFRLAIDSQNDIKFKDKDSSPNTFYPILGKYITIVGDKN